MTLLKKIRLLILFFIVALILSGVTAFPVETELRWLFNRPSFVPSFADAWLKDVYNALVETNTKYPMLAYGFDWLAFAHIVIAMAFIGPLKNPIKNKWIIDWAMLACVAVFPLAFIAAPVRHIPMFHVLIDCSFGVVGLVPLYFCRKWIKQLESQQ
jgi:membrane protease YdiL (CAAX protease family)